MAKKDKKEVVEEVIEEVIEEAVEEAVEEEKVLKLENNTIIDRHGFTWKVDDKGQKIERV